MRIWDIAAGYLARQQLLGEHRELHGLVNILRDGKRGYSRHPETLRWIGHLPALLLRHAELVAEMRLRGYQDRSPLLLQGVAVDWPVTYIDPPARQFDLLRGKYADGRTGRIPLPANAQMLWAQHKYSVMARDPALYREIGPLVAHGHLRDGMDELATLLVATLHKVPSPGRLYNALQHMWGYVSSAGETPPAVALELLAAIRRRALLQQNDYLLHSTALSELEVWLCSDNANDSGQFVSAGTKGSL